jgi:hypothetical protein
MKTNQSIPTDPFCDDHFDMELPDVDSLSNKIMLGCLIMLIAFAVLGVGACILVATGVLKFN